MAIFRQLLHFVDAERINFQSGTMIFMLSFRWREKWCFVHPIHDKKEFTYHAKKHVEWPSNLLDRTVLVYLRCLIWLDPPFHLMLYWLIYWLMILFYWLLWVLTLINDLAEIDKSNLTELFEIAKKPHPQNISAEMSYAAFKSILFGLPDRFNSTTLNSTGAVIDRLPDVVKQWLNGRQRHILGPVLAHGRNTTDTTMIHGNNDKANMLIICSLET